MLDTLITIAEAATTTYEVGKYLGALVIGDKKEQYLKEIAADIKDTKVHIEKLSDTILYAVNLDSVRAIQQKEQQYINDLREIRQRLESIQQVQKEPILSSAMITAPRQMASKKARQLLRNISPLKYITIMVAEDWLPVLFEEDGEYWIGWQQKTVLSSQYGCEYHSQWQPNHNVLPESQLLESNPLDLAPKPPPPKPKQVVKTKPVAEKKPEEKATDKKIVSGEVFQDDLKDSSKGPKMVWIPAGIFKMGDIQGTGDKREKPVRENVSVKGFAIGIYPVTFAEYDKFAEVTKKEELNDEGWGRDNRPVINVSWHGAVAYAKWLSEQTGQQYSLPSEVQWEYAARAGTETDYWWGNEIGKNKANCHDSGSQWSGKQTSPVGSFSPNPFGLYDTVGNVWEWIADSWHKDYKNAPNDDSIWAKGADKSYRVLRGGSWNNIPNSTRAAVRNWSFPVICLDNDGFRLVRRVARTS
ncbi:formylglycine-generating enzyme family protein [Candidatus Parabeggiatoa sp. HSG14]|uniref:formylglycine-generating enzyme family protein n=1 Tax=Candidatus Parabeggiatoa sp. HSG14 TaxID=3055593 RepID=UPI0025A6AFBF|nr:formylglycine-generating enzyme family protein [Thiotrichales bacterium HSG14]